MSTVTGLLGVGSDQGAGFSAAQAPLIQGVNSGQANVAYDAAQTGLQQQRQLAQALAAQNGIGNQSSVFNQQQALATALQNQANGQGPNPAQAALNQSTGQNVATQAALMAGQRGVGSNAGLAARQIGQQGAATQQAAVGQGATLQAQQQLAAQQALQQQQAQLASLSTQQVGQQQNAVQGYNQAAQGEQGQVLGAIGQLNNASVGATSNMNSTNEQIAGVNANNSAKAVTGIISGGSGALSPTKAAAAATGGMVGKDKIGNNPKIAQVPEKDRFPHALLPDHLKVVADVYHKPSTIEMSKMAGGGYVMGGQIPGKAKVQGDSLKNDVVDAKLSPGEVVIPRHVMESKDPVKGAADFVKETLASKLGKKSKEHNDFKDALKSAIKNRKSS